MDQNQSISEIVIVLSIAFGYSILSSIAIFFSSGPVVAITQEGISFLLVYEIIILTILGFYLIRKGWTLEKLGLDFKYKQIISGVVLGLGIFGLNYILINLLLTLSPKFQELFSASIVSSNINIIAILSLSIINPIFEEVFVCAYVIQSIEKLKGTSFAINTSIVLRLSYHLYQGLPRMVFIIPLALVFSFWYEKTRKLWTLIIAHAILDFLALILI